MIKKIGNLFVTHRNDDLKQISIEDEQMIKRTEQQMEVVLSEQCLYCGNIYIEGLDAPLVSKQSETEGMWNIKEQE